MATALSMPTFAESSRKGVSSSHCSKDVLAAVLAVCGRCLSTTTMDEVERDNRSARKAPVMPEPMIRMRLRRFPVSLLGVIERPLHASQTEQPPLRSSLFAAASSRMVCINRLRRCWFQAAHMELYSPLVVAGERLNRGFHEPDHLSHRTCRGCPGGTVAARPALNGDHHGNARYWARSGRRFHHHQQ